MLMMGMVCQYDDICSTFQSFIQQQLQQPLQLRHYSCHQYTYIYIVDVGTAITTNCIENMYKRLGCCIATNIDNNHKQHLMMMFLF